MTGNFKLRENIPLAPLTTFQAGGPARYFISACTEAEVLAGVAFAAEKQLPLFVLGGGSNIVVADQGWPGLVLKISVPGIHVSEAPGNWTLCAGAGENWDDVVALAVSRNCAGIECLSGIPGTTGGTPVQNVGAYGQEVSETIARVRVLEISTGKIQELNTDECAFSYRTSIFNSSERGRYIVLQVTYRLTPEGPPRIEYADLKKHFAGFSGMPTLLQTRDAVRDIRHTKAMLIVEGDEDCRSAGSFFKNPLVSPAEAQRVEELAEQRVPGKKLPRYPGNNGTEKLGAAWLVEQAGFQKGYARGAAAISRKHTLAIVNRGGAKAADILALKDEIQQRVFDVWGIRLVPEPVFVGF
ncbi:MAG TPA: UDP-N-acetylmuramate dehydrogenase [Candidatus Angelobacter sp.]|nr:UDP-N-acetylmuramate dehydrogenase [Candidatus Angelobacter sp.]